MAEMLMRKMPGRLVPTRLPDEEVINGLKNGELLKVRFSRPRNLRHHNKFWKLLDVVASNSDHYETAEELCDVLKIKLGIAEKRIQQDGNVYYKLGSIAFNKMDQDEFPSFTNVASGSFANTSYQA